MNNIEVACASDNQFLPFTACMLCSIMENNRSNKFRFFFLYDGIKKSDISRLDAFCRSNGHSFVPIEMEQNLFQGFRTTYQFTLATYYRQFLPTHLPQDVDKVIFLDSDLIVRRDMTELWETDIENYPLGAVEEPFSDHARLGLPKTTRYFNAGVMLINLRWWREHEFQNKVINQIKSDPGTYFLFNQDAMNVLLNDNWHKLPVKWNMMSIHFFKPKYRQLVLSELEDPAIVHFTGGGKQKPWHPISQHPFKEEYWRYQRMTPWKGPYPSYYYKLLGHYVDNLIRRFRSQD